MKKKSIGVIGLKGLPAYGGAAAVGENIINQLVDEYEFTVYSSSSTTNQKTGNYHGFNQIVFRKIPFQKINTLYYYILSAFHALFFGKYDVIHLHHRDAAFILTILKIKFKVILTTHGSFHSLPKEKYYKWFFKWNENHFVKKADIVTCVSKVESNKYHDLLNIDAVFIPNGVNLRQNHLSDDLAINYEYLFFGAGRIMKTKGLEVLLCALKKINMEFKLLIAGDIEQTKDYKKEILTLSKNLNVEYLGLIKDKNQLFNYIRHSKLFIFPSSIEAMSMMLLEAASQKAPIICSDINANKAIFNEDQVLFFKVDDSTDLANKIKWALDNKLEMQKKADRAFEELRLKYQWKNIAKEYDRLYHKLLK
jgi:glycosyltransferase involved in cell wall biosynthesis